MKLKLFNTNTCPTARRGEAYIRFNRKAGSVVISKVAADAVGITKSLEILQDEESPIDWYIRASDAAGAFQARRDKNSQHLIFNAASLSRAVEDSLKGMRDFSDNPSIRISIATKPVEDQPGLFALLTRGAK
jgi:hypothetical protein